MQYLAALKANIGAEIVARDFVQELVLASLQTGDLNLDLACSFVNNSLLAIGIQGQITPEQVEEANEGRSNYQWPAEQLQIYSFPYNKFEFARVEKFLQDLCKEVDKQNDDYIETLDAEDNNDEGAEGSDNLSPLELLMHMMAVWCSVYKHLLKENTWGTAQMFEEPLARINVCLLEGIHKLRKKYRSVFPVLDNICSRLYLSAMQGLRYKQSNDKIFSQLLELMCEDLDFFKENEIMEFFYEVCSLEYWPSILKLYEHLQKMLNELEGTSLKILTNVLIHEKMLKVYFTVMVSRRSSRYDVKQQEGVLKLLQILQGKLLTLDCFSHVFIEAILNLVLSPKTNISILASNVYLALMQRRVTDNLILMHILEFYLDHVTSVLNFKEFVMRFYKNFPYIANIAHLIELASNNEYSYDLHCLSSHIAVTIVELIFELEESPMDKVEPMLLVLPEMLDCVDNQQCIGIVWGLFKHVPLEGLKQQTLDHLIHYGLKIFECVENKFEYSLLMNIFINLHHCIQITNNWEQLELLSDTLAIKFDKLMSILRRNRDDNRNDLPLHFYRDLDGILKRFNILMKTKYDLIEFPMGVIKSLQQYVLMEDALLPPKTQDSFMDIYALEICVSGFLKVLRRENPEYLTTSNSFTKALELSKYLEKCLKNIKDFVKIPAFRLKAYICGLLNLYQYIPIALSQYQFITNILISLQQISTAELNSNVVPNEIQLSHPMQTLKWYRVMFLHYIELHKYQHVEIKSNIVWKLCINYGKPHNKFNEELQQLLITLITSRFNIYKHIIAVVIYNLYKQQPPLKNAAIVSLLKKHKHLIDNEASVESRDLLKIHIVLLVLEIVEKALSVLKGNSQQNRLLALKNLNIFLEDTHLSVAQAKDLILEQIAVFDKYAITREETEILQSFKTDVLGNR
ncbi:uncharacterized protein LOC106090520 [Stomoxys calcitrans]|uniref:uncharacterized protein LOC106090520 n=1 Tax=Stomoxys calcitrans TaxID=35570 RepID=UPI0027E2D24B|nr:uncharacterized protein LOC106090520 [Stomoxys calcitrans]